MHLKMSIGSKVIDCISVDAARCKDDNYLQALRRLLTVRHELTIAALKRQPTFYIEVPSVVETVIEK